VLTAGIIFSVLAFLTFLTSILFFEQYTVRDLLSSEEARAAFIPIIISGALELAALIPLLLLGAHINSVFVREHTGILPSCKRYTSEDRDYHKALITRGYLAFGLGLISGAMRFINTVLKFNARLLFTDITDITRPTIVTSAIPWFHIAVFAVTAIYAVVSFSYFSTVKEEIDIKHEKEKMH
jgi:hypothetical protein